MILSGPPSRRRGLMSPWLPCFGAALLLSCAGTTYGTGDASDTLDRGASDEDASELCVSGRGAARHPGGW
jgi:hypothetical protein